MPLKLIHIACRGGPSLEVSYGQLSTGDSLVALLSKMRCHLQDICTTDAIVSPNAEFLVDQIIFDKRYTESELQPGSPWSFF